MPNEFVPGAAALVPSAPPPAIDMCDPMLPRAYAAPERARQARMQTNEKRIITNTPNVGRPAPRTGLRARFWPPTIARAILKSVTELDMEGASDLVDHVIDLSRTRASIVHPVSCRRPCRPVTSTECGVRRRPARRPLRDSSSIPQATSSLVAVRHRLADSSASRSASALVLSTTMRESRSGRSSRHHASPRRRAKMKMIVQMILLIRWARTHV